MSYTCQPMTMTIAIWRHGRRQPRQPEITEGRDSERFGKELTPARLASALLRGNRPSASARGQPEAPDQPRHRQPLHQDREGDDHEGGEDDRVALRHGRRHGERQRQRQVRRAARPRTARADNGAGSRQRDQLNNATADKPTVRAQRAPAAIAVAAAAEPSRWSGWLATFIPMRMNTKLLARKAKYSHAERTRCGPRRR